MIEKMVPADAGSLNPRQKSLLQLGTVTHALAGDYPRSMAFFSRDDLFSGTAVDLGIKINVLANMSWVASAAGDEGLAEEYLARARSLVGVIEEFEATAFPTYTYVRAVVHVAAGNRERGLALIGEAVSQGYRSLFNLQHDPALDSLRDDPEFALVVAAVRDDLERQREHALNQGWLVTPVRGKVD